MSPSKNTWRRRASEASSLNTPAPEIAARRAPAPANSSRQRPADSAFVMSTASALKAIWRARRPATVTKPPAPSSILMSRSLPFWAGMDWSLSEVVAWRALPPLPAVRGEGLARERKASGAQRSGGEGAFQDEALPDTPPPPPPRPPPRSRLPARVGLSPHRGERRCAYDPAFTLSRILPSISSRPAGTAGYHLMLSIAACGKLSAYCSLSLPCVSLSAPFEGVKLPAEAATFAAISGRILKLIHL